MSESNFRVIVDVAAPVAAKIEAVAAEYEGKYTLDYVVYKRVLNTYKKFIKFASQNDGGIRGTDVCGAGSVKIVAEVPDIDLSRERLNLFSDLLAIVDSVDISVSKNGNLIIEVSVTGLWKAV